MKHSVVQPYKSAPQKRVKVNSPLSGDVSLRIRLYDD